MSICYPCVIAGEPRLLGFTELQQRAKEDSKQGWVVDKYPLDAWLFSSDMMEVEEASWDIPMLEYRLRRNHSVGDDVPDDLDLICLQEWSTPLLLYPTYP